MRRAALISLACVPVVISAIAPVSNAIAQPAEPSASASASAPTTQAEIVGADNCPKPSSVTGYTNRQSVVLFGRKGYLQSTVSNGQTCAWGFLAPDPLGPAPIAPGDRIWLNRNGKDLTGDGGMGQAVAGQTKVWTAQAFRDGASDSMNVCIKMGNRPDIRCSGYWVPAPSDSLAPTETREPLDPTVAPSPTDVITGTPSPTSSDTPTLAPSASTQSSESASP